MYFTFPLGNYLTEVNKNRLLPCKVVTQMEKLAMFFVSLQQ